MREVDDPVRRGAPRPDMLVRRMRRSDVEVVHEIHRLCLTQCLTSHYSLQQIDALQEGRTPLGYWLAAERGEHFLVVEVSETVAGYASWRESELLSMYIAPIAQGHGLGTYMFEGCTREAERLDMPIMQVCATLNATSFYRGLGFRPVEQGFEEKEGVRIPHMLMVRPVERTLP